MLLVIGLLISVFGVIGVSALLFSHKFKASSKSAAQSSRDRLTGLLGREEIELRAKHCLASGQLTIYTLIDIHRFTNINITKGCHVGDRILKSVALLLSEQCKSSCAVVRVAGDQFGLLSCHVSPHAMNDNLHGIIKDVEVKLQSIFGLRVRFNVASVQIKDATLNDIHNLTEYQLKKVCHEGFGNFSVVTDKIEQRMHFLAETESALQDAIRSKSIQPAYQLKKGLQTGKLDTLEVLARWNHNGAVMPPSLFIETAERTGDILQVTEEIIHQGISQLQESGLLGNEITEVSFNLSPALFFDESIVSRTQKTIEKYNDVLKYIKVEITESLLMAEGGFAQECLTLLRQNGVKISIDDFGTGYSSLSQLHNISVDEVKIDRVFIRQFLNDDKCHQLVELMLNIAKRLNIEVVAEGIETQAQAKRLTELGCDKGQGFLFARPVYIDGLVELMRSEEKIAVYK